MDIPVKYWDLKVNDHIKVQEPGQRFSHAAYQVMEITPDTFYLMVEDGSSSDGDIIEISIGLLKRCTIVKYDLE